MVAFSQAARALQNVQPVVLNHNVTIPPGPRFVMRYIFFKIGLAEYESIQRFYNILHYLPENHVYIQLGLRLWGSREAILEALREENLVHSYREYYLQLRSFLTHEELIPEAVDVLLAGIESLEDVNQPIPQGHLKCLQMILHLLTAKNLYGISKDIVDMVIGQMLP